MFSQYTSCATSHGCPYPYPRYFVQVPFGTFIKMNPGTWHAGPHFDTPNYMDFYNLELSDTNQVDHYNFHFDDALQTAIKIIPCD